MRTVPAPSASRNVAHPALFLTLLVHLVAAGDRLRAICLRGWFTPSWRLIEGKVVAFVQIHVDPESDTLLRDERRARQEVRNVLIDKGFYVGGAVEEDARILRVTGYFGETVYASDPARCPACASGACVRHDSLFHELRDDGPAPVSAPRRIVRDAA